MIAPSRSALKLRETAPDCSASRRTPPAMRGTASKKNRSASEGNGTSTLRASWYQHQMPSPTAHDPDAVASRYQEMRRRPVVLVPAQPQAAAPSAAATPSPMSSVHTVTSSPRGLKTMKIANTPVTAAQMSVTDHQRLFCKADTTSLIDIASQALE